MILACAKNLHDATSAFVALAANSVGFLAKAEQDFLSSSTGTYSPFTGKNGVSHYNVADLRGRSSSQAVAAAGGVSSKACAGRCPKCSNVTVASSYNALRFCTACGGENIVDTSATAFVAVAEGVNMDDYEDMLVDDDGALDSVAMSIGDLRFNTDEDSYAEFDRMVRNNSARAGMIDLDSLSLAGCGDNEEDEDDSLAGGCSDEDDALAGCHPDKLSMASDYEYDDGFSGCATASGFRTMDELFAESGSREEDDMEFSVAGDDEEYDPECEPDGDCDDGEGYDDTELNLADDSADTFDIPNVDAGFADVSNGLAAMDGEDEVVVDSLESYPALAADSVTFRYSQSADPTKNAWLAFDSDNRPFAMASAGIVPEKLRAIFDTERYRDGCYAAVASAGTTGLRSMGFYGFKHKLNVGNALRETASKERATASAEYSAALRQRDNEMISCIATIAVAMDRGFSGHRNPLKDAIVQTAVASGLDGSIVTRIVNQAFASHGSEYAEMLLRGAEAFRQKPLVVREELTQAIAAANYNDTAAAPQRTGLSSAVASVQPATAPAQVVIAPQTNATMSAMATSSNGTILIAGGLVRINN